MTNNLLPCPFCGYDASFVDEIDYKFNEDLPKWLRDGFGYAVVCIECNARGSEELTEQKAIDSWNKRS